MHPNQLTKRLLLPTVVGLLGVLLLIGFYLGVVSFAQSPEKALNLFWQNKLMLLPIALGFGLHAGMFTLLKKGLHQPVSAPHSGIATGASGGMSGVGMLACCAPALVNTLPLLGLTALTTFLANWQTPLMIAALVSNAIGIGLLLRHLLKERKRVAVMWGRLKQL